VLLFDREQGKMALPSVNIIRERLTQINDATVDEPRTTNVDFGDIPCVPIFQPDLKFSETPTSVDNSGRISIDEEPSIIFEIPPEFDERSVTEMLGDGGRFKVRATDQG
jgi:hypothetical protein